MGGQFHLPCMDLYGREQLIEELATEGLGGSIAIYVGAVVGTLCLIAVPIYAALSPQVYENPRLQARDPLLQGPIVGNRVSSPVPLAHLKPEVLVDPKYVAELNARLKSARPAPQQVAQPARVRERGPTVADLPDRRDRPGFSLFNLFGG